MTQYNTIASYYEQLMGNTGDIPNNHLLNPVLSTLLPHKNVSKVLDAGCGTGR